MPKLKQNKIDTAPTLFDTTIYQNKRQYNAYDWEDCGDDDEPVLEAVAPVPVEEEIPRAEEAEKCRQEFLNYLNRQGLKIRKIYNITLTKKGVPVISYVTIAGKKATTFFPKKLLSDAIFGMCNALVVDSTNDLVEPTVTNIREVKCDKRNGFIWDTTDGNAKKYKDQMYGAFNDLCTTYQLINFFNDCWLNLDAVLYLRQSLVPASKPSPTPKPSSARAPAPQPSASKPSSSTGNKRQQKYQQLTLF